MTPTTVEAGPDLVGAGLAPPAETEDAQAERLSAERQAAAIDGEFAADQTQPIGPGQVGPIPAPINALDENRAILEVVVATLTPALPFLPTCYPPPTIDAIARAYTAVEQKHGWNLRSAFSVEGILLMTALPPTLLAVQMGRAHFAKRRAEAEAEAEAVNREQGRPEAAPKPAPKASSSANGVNSPQPNASSTMTRVL